VSSIKLENIEFGTGEHFSDNLAVHIHGKHNMIPNLAQPTSYAKNGSSYAATTLNGVTINKLPRGLFLLNGTPAKASVFRLYQYNLTATPSNSYQSKCPIILKAGHKYYISGCQVYIADSPLVKQEGGISRYGYRHDKNEKTGADIYKGKEVNADVNCIDLTGDGATDKYVYQIALYYTPVAGTFNNYLYYPQITEDRSAIIGDVSENSKYYEDYINSGITNMTYIEYLDKYVIPDEPYSLCPLIFTNVGATYYDEVLLDFDNGLLNGEYDYRLKLYKDQIGARNNIDMYTVGSVYTSISKLESNMLVTYNSASPVRQLPEHDSSEEDRSLVVQDGKPTWVRKPTIHAGSVEPSSDLGADGDIYIMY